MREDVRMALIICSSLFIGMMIGGIVITYPLLYMLQDVTENYRDCVNDWSEKMVDGIKCERMLGECTLKGSGGYASV